MESVDYLQYTLGSSNAISFDYFGTRPSLSTEQMFIAMKFKVRKYVFVWWIHIHKFRLIGWKWFFSIVSAIIGMLATVLYVFVSIMSQLNNLMETPLSLCYTSIWRFTKWTIHFIVLSLALDYSHGECIQHRLSKSNRMEDLVPACYWNFISWFISHELSFLTWNSILKAQIKRKRKFV